MSTPIQPDDFDALSRILDTRYSCRAYRPDPVPREVIQTITAAAGRAPSWCNAQPWQLIVTAGDETEAFRTRLMQAAQEEDGKADFDFPASYSGALQERRRTCGWQLYEAVGVEKGDRAGSAKQTMENFRLFGAPHVAILTTARELGPYGAMDCGGFVTAFTLAATAAGVATVAQAAVARYSDQVRAHFDIPEDRMIACAISFGYADTDHPANSFRTTRAPLGEVLDLRGA